MTTNKRSARNYGLTALLLVSAFSFTGEALATTLFDAGIPASWTCTGNCGTSGANGVVGLAPSGGTQYGWVSTQAGTFSGGLGGVGGTNGSILRSSVFSAAAGDALAFQFDFVTSDGSGWADYAWSRLLDSASNEVAPLFTARTTPTGNSVPGFGMPAIAATMTPSTVTIIPGGPTWAPLSGDGYSNGGCFDTGCGYSGWVSSTYSIAAAGNYILEFGVTNWGDTAWQTGLAFDGVTVGGTPIEDTGNTGNVPEPASLALMGIGIVCLGAMRRRKQAS